MQLFVVKCRLRSVLCECQHQFCEDVLKHWSVYVNCVQPVSEISLTAVSAVVTTAVSVSCGCCEVTGAAFIPGECIRGGIGEKRLR